MVDCNYDIDEFSSRDKFVGCEVKKSYLTAGVAIAFIIIFIIIALFFPINLWYKIMIPFLGLILIALTINYASGASSRANHEYDRFDNKLKVLMDNGMTRGDALKEFRAERRHDESVSATNNQSKSQLAGMFAIANAVRR